jgi:hypothetical protein
MKSAHKLGAALAVFILLSVAAYFIITGLQGASSGVQTPPEPTRAKENNTAISRESAAVSAPAFLEVRVGQSTAGHETSDKHELASSSPEAPPSHATTNSLGSTDGTTSSTASSSTTSSTAATTPAEPIATSSPDVSSSEAPATTTASPPTTTPMPTTTTAATTTSASPTQPAELGSSSTHPAGNQVADGPADKTHREPTLAPIDVSPEEEESWHQFRAKYGKSYMNQQEYDERRRVFLGNLRFIKTFNQLSDALFKLDVNHFADLSRDEINNLFIGPKLSWPQTAPPTMRILPDSEMQSLDSARSVDWRNLTANEIVDQGTCKDSAIFALVAAIESTINAAGGPKTKLSEQQIIDCLIYDAAPERPPVCSGLLSMTDVAQTIEHKMIPFASAQEYAQFRMAQAAGQAPARQCVTHSLGVPNVRTRLSSYVTVPRDNIDEALLNSSPLVVAIDASQSTFHFYKSGLYHDHSCSTDSYNYHGLLVAYTPASPPSEPAAYTLRTSLGMDWGELGHMRLVKDPQMNKCLPQNYAIYPNIAIE